MRRTTLVSAAMIVALGLLPGTTAGASRAAAPSQETARSVQSQAEDAELEARVQEVAAKLRCPTCRALSVLDSPSGMAQEMRNLIREQLQAGKTTDEVLAYFVDRYGEWILLEPKAQGFNWMVWLLPIFLLLGGLAFVWVTARRWVRQGQARASALVEESQVKE